ncbi:hypothetical protein HHI36_015738 [Cryptolaemus montrouzieri]|uniref:Uncharacterized protein n=1 Tax=Cryptolaemus montrouzieri TaxID=559131 RepID=A0ABD2N7S2_9CUCU
MKLCLVVCLLGLMALTCAGPVEEKDKYGEYKIADKDYLRKYKLILQLFSYINQPSYYKEIVEVAKEFDLEKNIDNYEKPEVVKEFLLKYRKGYLPRGEIFSVFYFEQLNEAKALFKLFYYAKDFSTLYKTACWARQYLNEGLFLYSFSVALVQREDCRCFSVPPIYEIYPYYFFNTEVIQKASYYKQKYCSKDEEYPIDKDGFKGYTINANYSGYYLNLNPEQSLSYYLEDIGVNSYYYYYNLYYPFWWSSEEGGKKSEIGYRRGEAFYYNVQQLLARYYLERLANNYGDIPDFEWDLPFETGYYPSLRYSNGLEFPSRPNFANLKEYFFNYGQKQCPSRKYQQSYTYVLDYFRRLRDTIDKGIIHPLRRESKDAGIIKILNEEGVNILGNLIQANGDSLNQRYFGPLLIYARHLLGYSYQPKDKYQLAPSALQHFETSLRDPAFYQLYKKIYYLFNKYKQYLPAYKKEDLYYPGVSIKSIIFDELRTYYDHYYSDLSNALYVTKEEAEKSSFKVRAKQYRLNHKPFNYKVYVEAEKPCRASVRVYLGPKYDEYGRCIDIEENRINFVQFDYFEYNLTAGENVILRNYNDLYFYCNDRTSYRELYQQVLSAESGKGEYKMQGTPLCFPRRFSLPKGSVGGTPYQFYVIVSPYKPTEVGNLYNDVYKNPIYRVDGYPLGYPFDRYIQDPKDFEVPNAYLYETKIYFDDAINKYHPF